VNQIFVYNVGHEEELVLILLSRYCLISFLHIVCVPPGVSPGQTIRILHPDGSGRQIEAQVPSGMAVGSTFYVQTSSAGKPCPIVNETVTPIPVPFAYDESMAMAYPVGDYSDLAPGMSPELQAPPTAHPRPFSECLDNPAPRAYGQSHEPLNSSSLNKSIRRQSSSSSSSQKLLRVTVPPGTAPGSTIHVQVPRENYFISAQVPPNCSEFHVQYNPLSSNQLPPQQHISDYGPPFFGNYHQNQPTTRSIPDSYNKLLLVRVPPGTSPGTKLIVQIPDEPGRMLSAEVPPGNIREFQVAYESRPISSYRNVSPTAPIHLDQSPPEYGSSHYDSSTTDWTQPQSLRQQQYEQHHQPHRQQQQQQQHPWNTRSTNNTNSRRNSTNGDDDWFLPTVGGLSAGAASVMVFDHFVNSDE
jgi:hypothetical protein